MATKKAKKNAAPKSTTKKPGAKPKPSAKRAKPSAKKPSAKKPKAAKKPAAKKPAAKKPSAKKAVAKKPAAKKASAKKAAVAVKAPAKKAPAAAKKPSASTQPKASMRREDHPGHLDQAYAASLRSLGGSHVEEDHAFVDGGRAKDDLAEELGEEAVVGMTSGEDGIGDDLQAEVEEEGGGPFVSSTAGAEFADDEDASNPEGATREPFPRT